MASRWVLGPTGALGISGTPSLSLIPGLGLPEAAGGSGCDGAVGAVPQGTCAADLYRHPQLDADIEAVKEIYSENAVAVRWVRLLPPAPGSAIPGHAAGPHQEPSCATPGIQLCCPWAPNCAMPRHPAMPSLGHLAMASRSTWLSHPSDIPSPGHWPQYPLGTWLCCPWAPRHGTPGASSCGSPRHSSVPSSDTQLCHPGAPGCAVSRALSCGITGSPGHGITRHPAVPSRQYLSVPSSGIQQCHPQHTWACHSQAPDCAIVEHPVVAPVRNQLCHPRGT